MARYVGPHNSGNEHGFIYDIAGENPSGVAQRIIDSADMPFTFQGQVQNQVSEITPAQVPGVLQRGGMVAAFAQVGGSTVTVRITNPNQVIVIPHDGRQDAADRLMGTGFSSGGYGGYEPPSRGGAGLASPGGYGYDDYNMIDEIERSNGTLPANSGETPVGVGEWILTWILLAIPVVNLIAIIVWLAGKKTKKSKKNYVIATIIMTVISILLSAACIFFFGDQIKPYLQNFNVSGITQTTNTNANANANANANGNLADRMIKNLDNENANAENTGTEGSAVPVEGTEQPPVEEPAPVASMEVNIDAASLQTLPDNRRAIIITATAYNTGQVPFRPSGALRLMANQGIANLERNLAPGESFLPSTMEDEIAPAASGSFQFSYYLSDDQPVHITILNEATLGTVAEQEFAVV